MGAGREHYLLPENQVFIVDHVEIKIWQMAKGKEAHISLREKKLYINKGLKTLENGLTPTQEHLHTL